MKSQLQEALSAEVRAALAPLCKAYTCAQDLKLNPWEFSLRLLHLLDLGVSEGVLRWLVSNGYVEFADEVTTFRDPVRRFRSSPSPGGREAARVEVAISFGHATCFVLSEKGARVANLGIEGPHFAPPRKFQAH